MPLSEQTLLNHVAEDAARLSMKSIRKVLVTGHYYTISELDDPYELEGLSKYDLVVRAFQEKDEWGLLQAFHEVREFSEETLEALRADGIVIDDPDVEDREEEGDVNARNSGDAERSGGSETQRDSGGVPDAVSDIATAKRKSQIHSSWLTIPLGTRYLIIVAALTIIAILLAPVVGKLSEDFIDSIRNDDVVSIMTSRRPNETTTAEALAIGSPPYTSTSTAIATATPDSGEEPTPQASHSPAATASPSASAIGNLFADNFESGVSDGWDIDGNNFGTVNGQFASLGWLNAYVGDATWSDYAVVFELESLIWSDFNFGLRIQIRRRDNANYYEWQLNSINSCKFRWLAITDGLVTEIVGSEVRIGTWTDCPGRYRIEADGSTFRTIKDGKQELVFTNSAFADGGIGLISTNDRTEFTMDNFEIWPIP